MARPFHHRIRCKFSAEFQENLCRIFFSCLSYGLCSPFAATQIVGKCLQYSGIETDTAQLRINVTSVLQLHAQYFRSDGRAGVCKPHSTYCLNLTLEKHLLRYFYKVGISEVANPNRKKTPHTGDDKQSEISHWEYIYITHKILITNAMEYVFGTCRV